MVVVERRKMINQVIVLSVKRICNRYYFMEYTHTFCFAPKSMQKWRPLLKSRTYGTGVYAMNYPARAGLHCRAKEYYILLSRHFDYYLPFTQSYFIQHEKV